MATVRAITRGPPEAILPTYRQDLCTNVSGSLARQCPLGHRGRPARMRRTGRRMTEDVIAARARALAGALTEAGFARLRVRDGDTEIELRRAPRAIPAAALASPVPAAAADTAERPAEPRGR